MVYQRWFRAVPGSAPLLAQSCFGAVGFAAAGGAEVASGSCLKGGDLQAAWCLMVLVLGSSMVNGAGYGGWVAAMNG